MFKFFDRNYFNATDINKRSGYILAAINGNKEAVDVIHANYQNHGINLKYKNPKNGYSGVDYYHQNWPNEPKIKLSIKRRTRPTDAHAHP